MQLFNTFVVACAIFTSSVVANPAVASPGGTADNADFTVQCFNKEKLAEKDGYCIPALSKGFISSYDCRDEGGSYYYCVDQDGKGTCFNLYIKDSTIVVPDYEGGECFDIITAD